MAGTVWEWCQNAFDDPENCGIATSSQDSRVLRGGSWFFDQGSARATLRYRNYPSNRDNFIGFRVVCSSPSTGH